VDVVGGYVELGLRLGRHVDGLVDAYYGPPEIAERVEAEPLRPAAQLAADAAALQEELDRGLDAHRAAWLTGQLVGLETVARRLAGEEIPFADEVERCYGVRPRRTPEEEFERAHRDLDASLPPGPSLAERYQAWREGNGLQGDALRTVVASLAEELRTRTAELLGLPPGESVTWDFVTDEPWAAFNYYQGGLRSRIAVNLDVGLSPNFTTELVAHEAYPGHHTEHAWKEHTLVRGRGQTEESILMIGTPQSTIAEGIAGLAPEIPFGEDLAAVTARHVAAVGLEYDAEIAKAVKRAAAPLERVVGNGALMLHEDGASEDETRDYLIRWGLSSERRASHNVRFMTDPVWRSYITIYSDGEELCRDWVGGDPVRFRRLLTEQLSPADLLGGGRT
jgi:hypothetical protein